MYYVTKLSPECANAARELSQHMTNPGTQQWKSSFGLFKAEEGTYSHLPTAVKDADNWICRLEFRYECG